jgi:Uma2 family endonuclease
MVRLAKQRRRRVPDLLFVSKERSHLLRPNHLEGAPDLSVEIVSPDSQSRDRRDKFAEYEAAGVREYWIVDPLSRTVEAYALHAAGKFRLIEATDDGRLASAVLPGFYLRPDWLWQEPLPDVIATLRELGVQV